MAVATTLNIENTYISFPQGKLKEELYYIT